MLPGRAIAGAMLTGVVAVYIAIQILKPPAAKREPAPAVAAASSEATPPTRNVAPLIERSVAKAQSEDSNQPRNSTPPETKSVDAPVEQPKAVEASPRSEEPRPSDPPKRSTDDTPVETAKEPLIAPEVVAAAEPSYENDPTAFIRLRQRRFASCVGDDASVAIPACRDLISKGGLDDLGLAQAHRSLALALRKSGKYDESIESFSTAIKLAASAKDYDGRGIAYILTNRPDKAIADFDQSLRLDDQSGDAYNNRAWTYYKMGRMKDAILDADKAVELIPGKAYVWDTRGHINEAMDNRKAAVEDFEKATSIDPTMRSSADRLKRLKGR